MAKIYRYFAVEFILIVSIKMWTKTYSCFQMYLWVIPTSLTVQQSCDQRQTKCKVWIFFKLITIACVSPIKQYSMLRIEKRSESQNNLFSGSYVHEWMANRELYCWGLIPSPKAHSTVSLVAVALGHVRFCQTKKTNFSTLSSILHPNKMMNHSSLITPAQICIPPGTDFAEHWGCPCRSRSQTTAGSWRGAPQSDNRLQREWCCEGCMVSPRQCGLCCMTLNIHQILMWSLSVIFSFSYLLTLMWSEYWMSAMSVILTSMLYFQKRMLN